MCLFSSFIGGLSGNRGRCTQPCRRLWQNGEKKGYLFSPRDLELAEHINKLKQIGVASLKIEGRMRSSEYVYKTVKAYRLLIDAPENDFAETLKEARKILAEDAAREKTTALFSGRDRALFEPQKAQCLGNSVGTITAINNGVLSITAGNGAQIAVGDRLRLSNPATDTTISFKIKECASVGAVYNIPFEKADKFSTGNPVYKTVDSATDQQNIEAEIDAMYRDFASKRGAGLRKGHTLDQTYTSLISNIWKEAKKAGSRARNADTLWVRFDNAEWLNILPMAGNMRYVFYLTKENLHSATEAMTDPPAEARRGGAQAAELPPFIGQRDIELYRQAIDAMIARGVTRWALNNISQFEFFNDKAVELTAGHLLYTWNAYTAAFFSGLGVKFVTASWEDDFLNIRKMCGPGLAKSMVVYLYGFAPVARSRYLTREMLEDSKISGLAPANDTRKFSAQPAFFPVFESEIGLLIPEKPIGIFTGLRKLKEIGVENFGIDLSYIRPDKKTWQAIYAAYSAGENPINTAKFNFKTCVA
jgi:putative protease